MTCAMASIAALEGRLARLAACALGEHGAGQEEGEEKDRYLYAIGGCDVMEEAVDRVERYDLVSGEWEALASMGEKRSFSGAAVVRGRICVVGGGDGSTRHSSCTMYDATADTWCALPAMNKGAVFMDW